MVDEMEIRYAVCDAVEEWMSLHGRMGLRMVLNLMDTVENMLINMPDEEPEGYEFSGVDRLETQCECIIPAWGSRFDLTDREAQDLEVQIETAIRRSEWWCA